MKEKAHPSMGKVLRRVCVVLAAGIVCGVCIRYRDSITVETIAALIPENKPLAACIMLLLFAVKSLVVFVYGGVLYAVSGILFPLPAAIVLNSIGAVLMIAVPYLVGRKTCTGQLEKLFAKYPSLRKIRAMQNSSTFQITLLVRITGIVPGTLVGIYFGACGSRFLPFLAASFVGMLPSVLSFSIMGTGIQDLSSPAFWISLCFELVFVLTSFCISAAWRKRTAKQASETEKSEKERV